MEEGVALPTITAAVDSRFLSALKDQRVKAASVYRTSNEKRAGGMDSAGFLSKLEKALYASKICSYAQGFSLMKETSKKRNYDLNLAEIARIWRGGCIIRAVFLDRIRTAFSENNRLVNLLMDACFQNDIQDAREAWKDVLITALQHGVPTPALSASYAYFLSYTCESLPANLIQGQRDYFGAHTYERINQSGIFHTQWPSPKASPS